jgi:hypothetical protein
MSDSAIAYISKPEKKKETGFTLPKEVVKLTKTAKKAPAKIAKAAGIVVDEVGDVAEKVVDKATPSIDFPIVGVGVGLIGFGIANRITRDFAVSALSAVALGAAAEYKKRSIPFFGRFLK